MSIKRAGTICAFVLGAASALSTTAKAQTQAEPDAGLDVVVTGFRASLADSLRERRFANGFIEVIRAEDIADFPAGNLAEALQRVPGVAIERVGGEGRSVTVRGLSGEFTRVRILGLEALATTGSKDSAGGANRGRGFDFQVFAAELFDSVVVRKSNQAAVEEGSLGATIDLSPVSPFDTPDRTLSTNVQIGVSDLSGEPEHRLAVLASRRVFDDRLAFVVSAAYGDRQDLEEGSSSGRWENPTVATNSGGCFESPGPCDPSTGTFSAVNSAWHARIPRYGRLTYEWSRVGLTAGVEYRPSIHTTISLAGLYSRWEGERDEQYLGIFSGWHRRRGVDQTDVREPVIDAQNQLVRAILDDVDVRSESRYDVLSTDFSQVVLTLDRRLNDRLSATLRVGGSNSIQDNPVQTTVSIDRYNQDGVIQDFSSSQTLPLLAYGFDVTDPGAWGFESSAALGDPSFLRLRPNRTTNRLRNVTLDLTYELASNMDLRVGVNGRRFIFETTEERRFAVNGFTDGAVPLPLGLTISDLTSVLRDFGRGLDLPGGTPRAWLTPDARRVAAVLDLYCDCVNAFGDFRVGPENQLGANRSVTEDGVGVYAQLDFKTRVLGLPVRGDIGLRYVSTDTLSSGFIGTERVNVANAYEDILPAMNLVLEARPGLILRVAAAKAMARPQLAFLTPGGTISNTARTLTIGNPLVEPVRADTYDLALEWYPSASVLFSASVFRKNLNSYIQTSTESRAFGDTGLPSTLLANGNTEVTPFLVTQLFNTAGGELDGFELSAQVPLTWLPGPFDRLGLIANYTRVESSVDYITDAAQRPVAIERRPLLFLSPVSWNATVHYEHDRLSARVSAAYRDGYLTLIPGGNGNDARGKDPALNVDATVSYGLREGLSLTLEGVNLTDESDSRWVSSERRNNEEYSHTGRRFSVGLRWTL